jgi:transcriptional regulator
MSQQIVGIEIPITRVIGKWKISQNRSPEDRRGVAAGLEDNADARSREMADLVAQALRKP